MPESQWFESWFDTSYYHLLYQQRDHEEAARFIEHLMRHLSAPQDALICDLACGNGRHSAVISEMGYHAVGLDLSSNNIRLARNRALANAEFYEHDMRKPFRIRYFDVILNLFTSFGYFETHREHLQTVENMSKGLRNGGRLVLDFLNVHKVRKELVPHSDYERDNIRFQVSRRMEDGYIVKHIHINEGKKDIQFEEKVRGYDLDEFTEMMTAAGLSIEEVFGSYQLDTFDPTSSDRLIICAKKG